MGRIATDALALACIVAGGAAGTAITLAALDDDGPREVTAATVGYAVASVDRTECVLLDGPRVVVSGSTIDILSGDRSPVSIRHRNGGSEARGVATGLKAGATVLIGSSSCATLDSESVERLRARLDETRARLEESRVQIEESRVRMEAAEVARVEADRELVERLRRELRERGGG